MSSTTAAKHSAITLFCDNGFNSSCRKYRRWTTTWVIAAAPMTTKIWIGRSVRAATRPNGIAVSTNPRTAPTRYGFIVTSPPCGEADIFVNCGGDGMLENPRQVNDGEDADPHNIEKMPEQAQPVQAGGDEWVQPAHVGLTSQEYDPEQADADVSAVGADQREEGREKTAAPRAGAGDGHAVEFRNLHGDEAESEQE